MTVPPAKIPDDGGIAQLDPTPKRERWRQTISYCLRLHKVSSPSHIKKNKEPLVFLLA